MFDLVPSDIILSLALALGAGAGIAALVVLLRRMPRGIPGLSAPDRFGAAFIAAGLLFVGITTLGLATARIVASIAPDSVTVSGLDRSVAVVDDGLMDLPNVEYAGTTGIDVTISDAPASITAWQLGADLLPMLLVLIVCATAVWLAVGILRGRPFGRRFPVALVIVACAVMVCGLFAGFCHALSLAEAARVLNEAAGADLFMPLSIVLDLSPIGWGLVIGLIAGAFQIGTRMQQDTKGLV